MKREHKDGKICPVLSVIASSKLDFPAYCIEDKCAWWQDEDVGISGHCAIREISKALQCLCLDGITTHED